MRRQSSRAFTIVELLVVVCVIAILVALLTSGISSALGTSRNSKQLANLRQLFMGWTLYANQYSDQCLPGFLSVDVQKIWKVSYRMGEKIDLRSSDKFDRAATQTYPWRLAPYLDYSWELLMGYRDDPHTSATGSIYTIAPWSISGGSMKSRVEQLCPGSVVGSCVATQPAYGYNAFYLGGWWDISNNPGTSGAARAIFSDATRGPAGALKSANAIARTIGGIVIPERMTVFAPGAFLAANAASGQTSNQTGARNALRSTDPTTAGAAWITPPWLGQEQVWSAPSDDPDSLFLYRDQAVAIMRDSKQIPVAKGDGNTGMQNYKELDDMRAWLNLNDIVPSQSGQAQHSGTFTWP